MFGPIGDKLTEQTGAQMFDRFRPQMHALSQVVAQRERAQLQLAQRLAEASDADVAVEELPDVEERAAQLEAMAEAASQASLDGWYFGEFAPDHLDNAERAQAYARRRGDGGIGVTYTESFDTDGIADEFAFAFAVFLVLMAVFEAVKSLTASDEPAREPTEQSVTFNEDALRRLEDGETIVVRRWHGRDLELSGTQVIDVEPIEDEEA